MPQQVFRIITPGPLTTVQDGGRVAARAYGVPEGGAMDVFALRAANTLVGNHSLAPALEVTLGGLVLEAVAPCLVAVAGASLDLRCGGRSVPLWTACLLKAGERIELGRPRFGARAYIALAGGVAVDEVLGGFGTYLGGGFGGLGGRALRAQDVIYGDGSAAQERAMLAGRWLPPERRLPYGPAAQLRVIPGPHTRAFPAEARATVLSAEYRVGAQSNRMGYRLAGPPLTARLGAVVRSLGVAPGVIQVPPGGEPILLMADAQTTGGYPIIATVISADLPLAAQLVPGGALRFSAVSLREAHSALAAQRALLTAPPEDDNFGAPI
jgi:biotin-dependent carboxylase-like uncharacterized protein